MLDAFRAGAEAPWADTLALRDPTRVATLSDSARTILGLSGDVRIRYDTARVPIFSGQAITGPGQVISFSVFAYVLKWAGTRWEFVRRDLVYAT